MLTMMLTANMYSSVVERVKFIEYVLLFDVLYILYRDIITNTSYLFRCFRQCSL